MSDEFLGDRRKALEEAFFAKHNQILLQRLQQTQQARQQRQALAEASGITDEAVLAQLSAMGISAETLAALALVPLVAVAWADGSINNRERQAALDRAVEIGLEKTGVAYRLLEQWLSVRPPPELLAAWKGYVRPLSAAMSDDARRGFKREMLDRARAVAEAAGGFLGIGEKISSAEEAMLNELERALPE